MSPVRTARLLAMAAVLSLIACTGCVPCLTWLPDSSGFLHTGSEGRQLVLYDVAQKKQQVLVANTGTKTAWPAVSPDGKRLAVARYVTNRDAPDYLEVVIYDRGGREVKHSTLFRWNAPSGGQNNELSETYLFWSPRSEHVIVLAGPNTGIYDVRNDGLIIVDNAFPYVIGDTPIRPDGDGFLVSRAVGDSLLKYTFVNWEGREYDLQMKPVWATEETEWLRFPLLYNSRWEGNAAVVKHGTARLCLDTARYEGSLQAVPSPAAEAGGPHQQVVFANGAVLRVWNQKTTTLTSGKESHFRIEYLDGPEGRPSVLANRTEYCLVFPAPNRRLAAVRCNPEGKTDVILIVNEKGEVAAEGRPGN